MTELDVIHQLQLDTNFFHRCIGLIGTHSSNDVPVRKDMCIVMIRRPGGRLNKKDGLTRYGDSHVKDKTS